MQQPRKFEGKIPKLSQPTAASGGGASAKASTEASTSKSSQEQQQQIVYVNMLPAANTLNGIPQQQQQQYGSTDGSVYQLQNEILCDANGHAVTAATASYQTTASSPQQQHSSSSNGMLQPVLPVSVRLELVRFVFICLLVVVFVYGLTLLCTRIWCFS